MKTEQITTSIDPEGLLIKCNVSYILMFFQTLVNQKHKLVADMMSGWMGVRVSVCSLRPVPGLWQFVMQQLTVN